LKKKLFADYTAKYLGNYARTVCLSVLVYMFACL